MEWASCKSYAAYRGMLGSIWISVREGEGRHASDQFHHMTLRCRWLIAMPAASMPVNAFNLRGVVYSEAGALRWFHGLDALVQDLYLFPCDIVHRHR